MELNPIKIISNYFKDKKQEIRRESETAEMFRRGRERDAQRMSDIINSSKKYRELGGKKLELDEYSSYQFLIDDNPELELMFARLFSSGFNMKGYYFHYDGRYNYSKTPHREIPIWDPTK